MGELVTLHPASSAIDLTALSLERAQHVLAIRAIDETYAAEFERRAAAFEEVCQTICMTSAALPTLPAGVREETRQAAERLPGIVKRVVHLIRPLAGLGPSEPTGAA